MAIRAVIFDFGSVLVRLEDPGPRRAWEKRLGLPEGGLAELVFGSEVAARASVGQAPDSAVWDHVARVLGLDEAQLAQLYADFWAGDHLDTALVAFLRSLRPRYKTAILSNAQYGARDAFMDVYGLHHVVDLMVISAEEGVAKPDPLIYRRTLERLDVQPTEALFVDDRLENVAAARALGMRAVHFSDPETALAQVREILAEAPLDA
ncbi:MAG: HAD family phosphatase [Anaerolineae bacterium]|nr:HAD family phosphatase [Anaerolineae bacterium]